MQPGDAVSEGTAVLLWTVVILLILAGGAYLGGRWLLAG
jgi:hypothetical protein